jgi:hypothetical protein
MLPTDRPTDRPAKSFENRVEFQLRGRQSETARSIQSPLAEAWDSEVDASQQGQKPLSTETEGSMALGAVTKRQPVKTAD